MRKADFNLQKHKEYAIIQKRYFTCLSQNRFIGKSDRQQVLKNEHAGYFCLETEGLDLLF